MHQSETPQVPVPDFGPTHGSTFTTELLIPVIENEDPEIVEAIAKNVQATTQNYRDAPKNLLIQVCRDLAPLKALLPSA